MSTSFSPITINELTSNNVNLKGTGVSGSAAGLTTTNIDYALLWDAVFTGGNLILSGHHYGDTVTLQVVDVDGIVAPAGTVLGESLTNWNVDSDTQYQHGADVSYPVKILQGLYVRIKYTNSGLLAVSVRANLKFHKILF